MLDPLALRTRILDTLIAAGRALTPAELSSQCLPRSVSDADRDGAVRELIRRGLVVASGGFVAARRGVAL